MCERQQAHPELYQGVGVHASRLVLQNFTQGCYGVVLGVMVLGSLALLLPSGRIHRELDCLLDTCEANLVQLLKARSSVLGNHADAIDRGLSDGRLLG